MKIRDRIWFGVLPAFLFLTFFFLLPIASFIRRSIFDPDFTLQHLLRIVNEPVYVNVLWITFKIAGIVTILTLILGYPLAYALYKTSGKLKWLILGLVLLPFWTSLLVRTFAFMMLLQRNGIINNILTSLGLVQTPLQMVYNLTGVLVGMTYMLLPYMILSVYSVMDRIDPTIEKIAEGLGAGRMKAFISTVLPLSLPGILVGSSLVFLLGIGFFVTPTLLGGRTEQMLSMVIETQVNELLNWGFGASLSVMLLAGLLLFGAVLSLIALLVARRTVHAPKFT